MLKILVVGAGATGGYFGARLAQAGRDVTFLVRERRLAQIKATQGLLVQCPFGDVHIPDPKLTLAKDLACAYDLIVLSCKAYDLDSSMDSIAAAVGPNTMILPLLNGMQHMQGLEQRFGRGRLLGGMCMISSSLDSQGRIIHHNKVHQISFGELDGAHSPRIQAVRQALEGAGFDALYSQHITQDMWDKWVMIAATAGMTCLMRAAVCDIVQVGGTELSLRLLQECADIAKLSGQPPSDAALQQRRAALSDAQSTMTASMMKDIEKGSPIESYAIIGNLLERVPAAQQKNFPLLQIVLMHLKAYEARRARESA